MKDPKGEKKGGPRATWEGPGDTPALVVIELVGLKHPKFTDLTVSRPCMEHTEASSLRKPPHTHTLHSHLPSDSNQHSPRQQAGRCPRSPQTC